MASDSSANLDAPRPRRTGAALAWCIAVIVLLTAADLGSKSWVEATLSRAPATPPAKVCETDANGYIVSPQRYATAPYVLIENVLEFHYAENCGAAFGLMRGHAEWVRRVVFVIAAVAAIAGLMWMFVVGRGQRFFAWSVPLIVSGALGNLVDRIRYGYVVDFVRFHWHNQWDYPTFNIADCGITVGVVFLVIDGFMEEMAQKRAAKVAAANASAAGSK